MSNLIGIDGGAAGTSRFDRTAGVAVALTAPGGYSTYAWTVLAYPEAVAPVFSAPTSQNTNLTPGAGYDGYAWRVRLVVDDGMPTKDTDIVIIGVPHATFGWIVPPAGVTQSEYDLADGWWNKTHGVHKLLADVMEGRTVGLVPSVVSHNTGTLTLLATHDVVLLDNIAGAISVQLPDPATVGARSWRLKITSDSKNLVTLLRFATEKIEGIGANKILRAPYGSWELICDGTHWRLLGKNRLELVYIASDTLVVQASWYSALVRMRCGAGGGGGGGGGFAGNTAGTSGGGGGKGGGGGASVVSDERELILPVAGTTLTLTVGAGGTGGTSGAAGTGGGNGGNGSASEILDGATSLLRHGHNNPVIGGGFGSGGNGATNATGASGGGGQALAAACVPAGFGANAVAGSSGGNGGVGAAGSAASATTPPSTNGGPWYGLLQSNSPGGLGGALNGTRGGGGGGGPGGSGQLGDEYSPAGVVSTADGGRGGGRLTNEGNGGDGNNAGVGVAGVAGQAGYAGTNGRGGGGGQGGGGGGASNTTGGAGGAGGIGGAGSAGLIVITVWE